MTEEIEALLKSEEFKTLKPDECALFYDEKEGKLVGICNKDGKLEITFAKKIEEMR